MNKTKLQQLNETLESLDSEIIYHTEKLADLNLRKREFEIQFEEELHNEFSEEVLMKG